MKKLELNESKKKWLPNTDPQNPRSSTETTLWGGTVGKGWGGSIPGQLPPLQPEQLHPHMLYVLAST